MTIIYWDGKSLYADNRITIVVPKQSGVDAKEKESKIYRGVLEVCQEFKSKITNIPCGVSFGEGSLLRIGSSGNTLCNDTVLAEIIKYSSDLEFGHIFGDHDNLPLRISKRILDEHGLDFLILSRLNPQRIGYQAIVVGTEANYVVTVKTIEIYNEEYPDGRVEILTSIDRFELINKIILGEVVHPSINALASRITSNDIKQKEISYLLKLCSLNLLSVGPYWQKFTGDEVEIIAPGNLFRLCKSTFDWISSKYFLFKNKNIATFEAYDFSV